MILIQSKGKLFRKTDKTWYLSLWWYMTFCSIVNWVNNETNFTQLLTMCKTYSAIWFFSVIDNVFWEKQVFYFVHIGKKILK